MKKAILVTTLLSALILPSAYFAFDHFIGFEIGGIKVRIPGGVYGAKLDENNDKFKIVTIGYDGTPNPEKVEKDAVSAATQIVKNYKDAGVDLHKNETFVMVRMIAVTEGVTGTQNQRLIGIATYHPIYDSVSFEAQDKEMMVSQP